MIAPFEVHLTLAQPGEGLSDWVSARGGKELHIELDRGETPSQPMLSLWRRDSLDAVRALAESWSRELLALGHRVVRIKIETPIATTLASSEESTVPVCYFECHVKLLLAEEPDQSLRRWIADLGAHLSRNARKRRKDGRHERFVTARLLDIPAEEALSRFAALEKTLRESGLEILQVECETCVHDSALTLDAGWLPSPGET